MKSILDLLLKRGVDFNVLGVFMLVFFFVIKLVDVEVVKIFLEKGVFIVIIFLREVRL